MKQTTARPPQPSPRAEADEEPVAAIAPQPFDPALAGGDHAWPEHGMFAEDGAYVLTDPATPRPWQNLLSNDEYLLSISQLGTGFSTYGGIFANRVTRSYAELEFDDKRSGRFFYLRDAVTGRYFCPTVFPAHVSLDGFSDYACRYEPGSMRWEVSRDGIQVVLESLVCQKENTELHRLTLTDLEGRDRTYDAFLYLEWAFSGAPEYSGFAIDAGFDPAGNTLWANVKTHPQYRFHQTGFITASAPILDFDCRRLAFEGPLGSIQRPQAVERGRCRNSGPPIIGTTTGAVRVRASIPAGGSTTVLFSVGLVPDRAHLAERAVAAQSPERFEPERAAVARYWAQIAARQRAELRDVSGPLAAFLGRWLPCQVIQNARWTRWAAHKGYRDVLQDAAGARLLDPARARRMIVAAVCHQRSDGHAPRGWDPAPWGKHQWIDSRDSAYWLFYSLDAYLRETADFGLLGEAHPFIDAAEPVTVWEHLLRAGAFLWTNRGAHALCLMGEGDWNDSLNTVGIGGKGESVWLTQALAHGLLLMEHMANASGRAAEADDFRHRRVELADALEAHAWDGAWYRRGYSDNGRVIGSVEATEGGHIYLLPQAWATISGTAPEHRARAALEAAEARLGTPHGPLLYTPGYTSFQPHLGRISGGGSESDAIYVHAALFYAHALLLRRDADRAWEVIRRVLPASGVLPSSRSGAEPFTCINAITGSGWSWPGWSYTGWWSASPSWLLQILVEGFLGARAEFGGLRIDPCLPTAWTGASLTRHFRGAEYRITIRKPAGPAQQGPAIRVNGVPSPSNLLPPAPAGSIVDVTCEF